MLCPAQLRDGADKDIIICHDDLASMCLYLCLTWEPLRRLVPPGDLPVSELVDALTACQLHLSPVVLVACHRLDDLRRSGLTFDAIVAAPAELVDAAAAAQAAIARYASLCYAARMSAV